MPWYNNCIFLRLRLCFLLPYVRLEWILPLIPFPVFSCAKISFIFVSVGTYSSHSKSTALLFSFSLYSPLRLKFLSNILSIFLLSVHWLLLICHYLSPCKVSSCVSYSSILNFLAKAFSFFFQFLFSCICILFFSFGLRSVLLSVPLLFLRTDKFHLKVVLRYSSTMCPKIRLNFAKIFSFMPLSIKKVEGIWKNCIFSSVAL